MTYYISLVVSYIQSEIKIIKNGDFFLTDKIVSNVLNSYDLFCIAVWYCWIKWFTTEILDESSSDEGGSDAGSGSGDDSDSDEGKSVISHLSHCSSNDSDEDGSVIFYLSHCSCTTVSPVNTW